jgi:formamidopyrimidine-DNA glycosylase
VPEGDTVFLAASRLHAALAGTALTRSDFRLPRYATVDLAGRAVLGVVPRGKHLLFRLDGGLTLHTHYKMEGSWHLYRHGERWRGPGFQVRVVLETAAWVAVGFRLPVVDLLPTADEHDAVGHLGPDPLASDWDAAEALRRLRAEGDRPIGDALLDQRVIAGPGNIYRCEICFLRGLDPSTPVTRVADLPAVVDLTKRLMDANRTTGSQITTGDPRDAYRHWVYGRGGRPCRRCHTPIARRDATPGAEGERVTYWCPRCQPSATSEEPTPSSTTPRR